MRLLTVSAGKGATWLRQGFATLSRHPVPLLGLCFVLVLVGFISLRVTWLLVVLAGALPMISLGFMNATLHASHPGASTLRAFFAPAFPLHPRSAALLRMTIVYLGATLLAGLLSSWAFGDSFAQLIEAQSREKPDPAEISARLGDPRLALGFIVQATLAALLSVPFWHAPALIFWGGQGVAQALFSSTLACWRNRGAFLVYGLSFGGVLLTASLLTGILLGLLGAGPVATMLALVISLVLIAAFYASLYFTFTDCFDLDGDGPQHPSPTDAATAPPESTP